MLGGFLADSIGRKKLIAMASIGLGVGWLVFAACRSYWHLDEFVYPLAIWEAVCTSVMLVSVCGTST